MRRQTNLSRFTCHTFQYVGPFGLPNGLTEVSWSLLCLLLRLPTSGFIGPSSPWLVLVGRSSSKGSSYHELAQVKLFLLREKVLLSSSGAGEWRLPLLRFALCKSFSKRNRIHWTKMIPVSFPSVFFHAA